jgi:hypothetical protein
VGQRAIVDLFCGGFFGSSNSSSLLSSTTALLPSFSAIKSTQVPTASGSGLASYQPLAFTSEVLNGTRLHLPMSVFPDSAIERHVITMYCLSGNTSACDSSPVSVMEVGRVRATVVQAGGSECTQVLRGRPEGQGKCTVFSGLSDLCFSVDLIAEGKEVKWRASQAPFVGCNYTSPGGQLAVAAYNKTAVWREGGEIVVEDTMVRVLVMDVHDPFIALQIASQGTMDVPSDGSIKKLGIALLFTGLAGVFISLGLGAWHKYREGGGGAHHHHHHGDDNYRKIVN